MKRRYSVLLGIIAAACGEEALQDAPARKESALSVDSRVLIATEVSTARGTFKYRKVLEPGRGLQVEVVNEVGQLVGEDEVNGSSKADPIGRELREAIARRAGVVRVAISLKDNTPVVEPRSFGQIGAGSNFSRAGDHQINGRAATRADVAQDVRSRDERIASARQRRDLSRAGLLAELNAREKWGLDSSAMAEAAARSRGLIRALHTDDVARFVAAHADIVSSVELHHAGADTSLATAMARTSVSAPSGILGDPGTQGAGIGVWVSESGSPAAGYLSNYTRMYASQDNDHCRNTTAIVRAVSPACWIYATSDALIPSSSELGGVGGHPPVRLLSFSWVGNFEADYTAWDGDTDDWILANFVPWINSAANEGAGTGNVGSPAKGLNVITVGNYDDSTMNMASSSSWRDPPNTKNNKPEISGPGQNITAGTDVAGNPITKSGTSQATPHIAGIVADMTQALSWLTLRPQLVKPMLMVGAIDSINAGTNFQAAGYGGVDALAARWNNSAWWWSGSNSDWTWYANNDGTPGDGALVVNIGVTAGNYNAIALSWLTRGTYTWAHQADAHPIGVDFDFSVSDPNGNYVCGGWSWDNPQEFCNFWAAVGGTYRVTIYRAINRDTSGPTHLGMVHKYW